MRVEGRVVDFRKRDIARGETDPTALAAGFRESAKIEDGLSRKNGSAVLELLARQAEADRAYVVTRPN
jgi:hypothetical protein